MTKITPEIKGLTGDLKPSEVLLDGEKTSLSKAFRMAIDKPERELDVWVSYRGGKTPKPKNEAVLSKLTVSKARAFFNIAKNELRIARDQRRICLSEELDRFASDQAEKGENWANHEIAHIAKAEELEVDLSKCALRCYFTISGWGLKPILTFDTPKINPIVAAEIAIAPEKPSEPDVNRFKNELRRNQKTILKDREKIERLVETFVQKTGKTRNEILEIFKK